MLHKNSTTPSSMITSLFSHLCSPVSPGHAKSLQKMFSCKVQYSTAFMHLVLLIVSAWAMKHLHQLPKELSCSYKWVYFSTIISLIQAVIGVIRFGNPAHGYKFQQLFDHIIVLNRMLAFPGYAIQLQVHHNYIAEIVISYVILSVFMVVSYYACSQSESHLMHGCMIAAVLPVLFLGCACQNYYAIAATINFIINFHFIGIRGQVKEVPAVDLNTICLCFFNIFVIKSLKD